MKQTESPEKDGEEQVEEDHALSQNPNTQPQFADD